MTRGSRTNDFEIRNPTKNFAIYNQKSHLTFEFESKYHNFYLIFH